jgi:hypothetical protein
MKVPKTGCIKTPMHKLPMRGSTIVNFTIELQGMQVRSRFLMKVVEYGWQ